MYKIHTIYIQYITIYWYDTVYTVYSKYSQNLVTRESQPFVCLHQTAATKLEKHTCIECQAKDIGEELKRPSSTPLARIERQEYMPVLFIQHQYLT